MRLIDADEIPWTDLSEGEEKCFVVSIGKINKMPTINTDRKVARWITVNERFAACSNCNSYFDIINNESNYCANCGAMMENG